MKTPPLDTIKRARNILADELPPKDPRYFYVPEVGTFLREDDPLCVKYICELVKSVIDNGDLKPLADELHDQRPK